MARHRIAFPVLALSAALASPCATAAQRTFVASTGTDAGSCPPSAPCRGFTYAQTQTDPGGEIVALDAAGYGAVTITKSLTITANSGFFAGIAASTGNAVTIATAGVNVILRGLNINGTGALNGVSMTNGASLVVENCVFNNFSNNAIYVQGVVKLRVSATVIRNSFNGIWTTDGVTAEAIGVEVYNAPDAAFIAASSTATTTQFSIRNSSASGGAYGFATTGTAGTFRMNVTNSVASGNSASGFVTFGGTMAVGGSQSTGNLTGFENSSGTFESMANNMVRGNGTPTSGVIVGIGGT